VRGGAACQWAAAFPHGYRASPEPQDPLAPWADAWEQAATALLLDDQAVLLDEAAALVVQGDNDAEV
jgi:hypothetical protein